MMRSLLLLAAVLCCCVRRSLCAKVAAKDLDVPSAKDPPFIKRGPVCGGKTTPGSTKWESFGTAGLSAVIRTSHCRMNKKDQIPVYLVTVVGDLQHWQLTGTNCVYDADVRSFRVYVYHPSMRKEHLLSHAKRMWSVSWVADDSPKAGRTARGKGSGWKQFGSHSLFMDVDTSAAKFKTVPHYVAALDGFHSHWRTVGSHSLYHPTTSGFRVFILYELSTVTPQDAAKWGWAVNWVASEDSYAGSGGGADWKQFKMQSDTAMYIDVNTTSSRFENDPSYVSSLNIQGAHQWVIGGASIYNPTVRGFRVYIDRVGDVNALKKGWRVHYLGYEESQDCLVSDWGPWGSCSKTCGSGTQGAVRSITRLPYLGGAKCPVLMRHRTCATNHCPVHCKVKPWSVWSECSRKCGFGDKVRTRTVVSHPKYGAAPCPKLRETKKCNSFPCAGTGRAQPCGGTTLKGLTSWRIFDKFGIYVEVDASDCKFGARSRLGYEVVPFFVASVEGHDPKFTTTNSIYAATSKGFRVFVWQPGVTAKELWFYATRYQWRVSWVGDTAATCGMTSRGNSGWQHHSSDALYSTLKLAVNTVASNFTATPVYIPALTSSSDPVRALGVHNVVTPDAKGFVVYVTFPKLTGGAGRSTGYVTAAHAEAKRWAVTWFGSHSIMSGSSTSNSRWKTAPEHKKAIMMDVDTTASKFPTMPSYVAAIWRGPITKTRALFGGSTVFKPSRTGFRVYVFNSGVTAQAANLMEWQVNYVGFTKLVDCKVSPWGPYDTCTKTCAGGTRTRKRKVVTTAFGGRECPTLTHTAPCNTQPCPSDCVVSTWTAWASCSKTCGGGSTLRKRMITAHPKSGGSSCPVLKQSKGCNEKSCPIDCKVSEWSAWSKCDEPCGFSGAKKRTRNTLIYARYGGVACPHLSAKTHCNRLPCVSPGSGRVCGGSSHETGMLPKWKSWKKFGSSGLYLDVDTTRCHFDTKPNYVVSVIGDSGHWQLTGVTSVYSAARRTFRMFVWHPSLYAKNLLLAAQKYKWEINWLADTGRRSGITTAGHTGWKQFSQNLIYVDVETVNSRYPVAPRYVTSIHGERDHWRAEGAHSIYNSEADGFRIYLLFPSITPKLAEKNKWTIAWVGSYSDAYSGAGSTDWKSFKGTKGAVSALYTDVSTVHNHFHGVPVYVTSVTGKSHHWSVSGGGSVYSPTKDGFRVYLNKAQSAYFAKQKQWRVNYIAFQSALDCKLSAWSEWSECAAGCHVATQERIRTVKQAAFNGGHCFPLKQKRPCNMNGCPQDCVVSIWGKWAACSRTCGGGQQSRARVVLKPRKFMGKQCPHLSAHRTCQTKPCSASAQGSADCKDRNIFGAWSECTRLCGAGFRYRYREHIMCSEHTHFIPYKMKYRQKEHCSLRPCVGKELTWKPHKVDIPPIRSLTPANAH